MTTGWGFECQGCCTALLLPEPCRSQPGGQPAGLVTTTPLKHAPTSKYTCRCCSAVTGRNQYLRPHSACLQRCSRTCWCCRCKTRWQKGQNRASAGAQHCELRIIIIIANERKEMYQKTPGQETAACRTSSSLRGPNHLGLSLRKLNIYTCPLPHALEPTSSCKPKDSTAVDPADAQAGLCPRIVVVCISTEGCLAAILSGNDNKQRSAAEKQLQQEHAPAQGEGLVVRHVDVLGWCYMFTSGVVAVVTMAMGAWDTQGAPKQRRRGMAGLGNLASQK